MDWVEQIIKEMLKRGQKVIYRKGRPVIPSDCLKYADCPFPDDSDL